MELGPRLQQLRSAAGLSTAELARRAGLSSALVPMIERGERGNGLTAETALRLAAVLGCTVEYLVRGTGEPAASDPNAVADHAIDTTRPVSDVPPAPAGDGQTQAGGADEQPDAVRDRLPLGAFAVAV